MNSTPPLRVVHYSSVWLEQTQTWLFNQIRHLPGDIENQVVCRSVRNLDQFNLPQLHCEKRDRRLGYLHGKALALLGIRRPLSLLVEKLSQGQFDILHSHFGNNGWLNAELASQYGVKHFVTFYGQDISKLPRKDPRWKDRYRVLFDQANVSFLCEGTHMAACLVALGCEPGKIHVHHLGVEVGRIAFKPRRWQKGEPLKVLIAASFREKKGIPYALAALGRIRREIPLEITIIGDAGKSADSQIEKAKILQAIADQGLDKSTRLLGYKPHQFLWEEAYRNHLFLSPSVTAADGDTEGGAPVSIIEMAASGMPIVSSQHCDIPGVILHGQSGWLAEERDVEGIIGCIRAWLDTDDWEPWLAAGRRHVESEFDVHTQSLRLAALYRASCGRVVNTDV